MSFSPALGVAPASVDLDLDAVVIGAGPAGLAAGKALLDRGVDVAWYEKGSYVGGLWQIDNDNGGVAAYETLHLNTHKTRTNYPSYPMPDQYPDFPSHRDVARYFESFADTHNLRDHIAFNTTVVDVSPVPAPDGVLPDRMGQHGWEVRTDDGKTVTARAVLVANGHHGTPSEPEFPGTFSGETMHSKEYRSAEIFTNKRVLVIGVGNSGMDLSCDAANVADHVFLSTRHGVHVLPKYILGKPLDLWTTEATSRLPFAVQRRVFEKLLTLAVGRPEDRGLPKPDHRLLSAHPSVSSDLYDRVGHGDITMKPGIDRFEGDLVHFDDGSSEQIDLIVFATGYKISLPFLDPSVWDAEGNRMPLYQRVLTPQRPGLFFIGFVQVIGSGIPVTEHQAEWVGDLLTGACVLPDEASINAAIAAEQAEMDKRYVRSARHTLQVDFFPYIRALERERKRTEITEPRFLRKITEKLSVSR